MKPTKHGAARDKQQRFLRVISTPPDVQASLPPASAVSLPRPCCSALNLAHFPTKRLRKRSCAAGLAARLLPITFLGWLVFSPSESVTPTLPKLLPVRFLAAVRKAGGHLTGLGFELLGAEGQRAKATAWAQHPLPCCSPTLACSAQVFTMLPAAPELLLRRPRLPLPVVCPLLVYLHDPLGDQRWHATGVLRARKGSLEFAAARACWEAGALVATHTLVQDLNGRRP